MISELRTLTTVARVGTFAAAGEELGLTQAAVSGHIRRLEEHLGFALFERTGRSATLNAAGRRTLLGAQDIIDQFDALANLTSISGQNMQLNIGAIASAQTTVVARALGPLMKTVPECQVHVAPGVSLQLLDRVDKGELDLALIIKPPFGLPRELTWQPVLSEPFMLVAPAHMACTDWQSLLKQHPFIRYDRNSFGGRQVDRFLKRNAISVTERLEIDDIQTIVSTIEQGHGIGILPMTECILPLPARLQSISLQDASFTRDIGIVQRKASVSYLATVFTEHLLNW